MSEGGHKRPGNLKETVEDNSDEEEDKSAASGVVSRLQGQVIMLPLRPALRSMAKKNEKTSYPRIRQCK
eukprot:5494442-Karenia_brevis.AAC.1